MLSAVKFCALLFSFTLLIACGSDSSSTAQGTSGSTNNGFETFTVSGHVAVARDTDVDDDVIQGFGSLTELNNNTASAQLISNPVTLGGYLSGKSETFVTGEDFVKDLDDFFRVSLVGGQQIGLRIFPAESESTSPSQIDVSLNLSLVSQPTTVIASLSFSETQVKTLSVPQTGEYFIHLGAGNNSSDPILYTLSLSQLLVNNQLGSSPSVSSPPVRNNSSSVVTNSALLLENFVEGEVIVRFKSAAITNKPTSSGDNSSTSFSMSSRITKIETNQGMIHKQSVGQHGHVFSVKGVSLTKALTFESFISHAKSSSTKTTGFSKKFKAKWQTLQAIQNLRNDPDILYAEPNYIRTIASTPNDSLFAQQWSLPMLQIPSAWDVSTGVGVVVAVIDTGIDSDHEDLLNNISADGFDFVSDVESSGDGDGFDSDPRDLGSSFHGSHVAGIVAAEGGNNKGVAGVAYNASIMPLRVLGIDDSGNDSDIANAILYAAGLSNSSGQVPVKSADVINLSLGGPGFSTTLQNAVNAAIASGAIVIAAAGNESSSIDFYPASYDGVIGVSSVTNQKLRSPFSNFGSFIDVAAPGGSAVFDGFQDGILSTVNANFYREFVGTSMATPHVSGIAALMKSLKPDLTHTSFTFALNSGDLTDIIGQRNFFGNGLINAAKAVSWAGGINLIPATLSVFPSQFSFINSNAESTLYLTNPGSGSVIISNVSTNKPWLEVTPLVVNSQGLGSYTIRVNSAAIPLNSFDSGQISVSYTLNAVAQQNTLIEVLASNTLQNDETVGNLFISLISLEEILSSSSETLFSFETVSGVLKDGVYSYAFNKVPAGQYFVRASTNGDGDAFTFDDGEARGIFPSFVAPSTITVVDQNLLDIDFGVQYPEATKETTLLIDQAASLNIKTIKTLPAKF